MKIVEVLRERKADGYVVRDEIWEHGSIQTRVSAAYTLNGDYIGNGTDAAYLCDELGISPEKRNPDNCVCSIGFSEKHQKWYGWSHRAIHGFKVGDEVKEGSCTAETGWTDEYLAEHPEDDVSLPVGFKAETLDDCRLMAIAFADCIS